MSRTLRALTAGVLAGLVCVPGSASAAGRAEQRSWHGNQVKLYGAESAGRFGSGVLVGVLDGWVDRSHPDFEGRVRAGADCTSGTCTAGEGRDGCTHGTHVAGTIASTSYGVASRATILPVRVLTDDGEGGCVGTPEDVAAGIRWAMGQGARVLNLSLGPDVPVPGGTSELGTAVKEAADAGIVVVFSAGNEDLPVAQSYGENAIVVAATGPNGQLADYSQRGAGVTVAAPGGQPNSQDQCAIASCVTSLYPGGQYAVAAGTSMAAPHVAGLAALLLGQQPSRSGQQVVDRITSTAHALSGAGSGLVDVRAALGVTTAAPAPSRSSAPVPVVRPPVRTTPRVARPAPKPVAKPAPTKASPPVRRTPSAVPVPVPTSAAPSPSAEPELALELRSSSREVPTPVAVVALALVAMGVTSVLTVARSSRSGGPAAE